jgi:signal transduction histidine kinase
MTFNLGFIAAVAAACVGLAALLANPKRQLNRVFFTASLHVALWLITRALATNGGPVGQDLFRLSLAGAAFIPVHLWVIKESIVSNGTRRLRHIVKGTGPWVAACALLAGLTFTQWFVPTQTGPEVPGLGGGFFVHWAGLGVVYGLLCRETLRQMRTQTGATRLELQIVLLGGSVAAMAVVLAMGLKFTTGIGWLFELTPIIVLCFFGGTTVAITTTRILDARQIIYVGLQKFSLIAIVSILAYFVFTLLEHFTPGSVAFVLTVALTLWCAALLNGWLDRLFRFYPQATAARHAAFTAAQRETRVDSLERAFHSLLKGWGHTEHSVILSGSLRQTLTGGAVELPGESAAVRGLQQLGWATPERLARERRTPERIAVGEFLSKHDLGLLLIENGTALTVVVGVGAGAARRPYTYPQVTQLKELASIMVSALERAHFSAKVQHTEQLATVGILGASLAHEIRNPLVSIKTFVQLLPSHYQDANFRDKFFKLIGDEVERIDQLTEQLLDLSAPRAYAAQEIELHPLLLSSLDLVTAKAAHRDVKFLTEFRASPDRAYTDASAAKQVMLNLCFNAIQAVDTHPCEERWVKIATRNTSLGIEMAVADSGPGIAPEIRPKLFQPFQTTKSSGFGLGLAICSDILTNLNASITVDPPEPGRGATFRVTFPCQPLSS